MKKVPLLNEKLVVKMMNKFDAQVIASDAKESLARPEIKAKMIERAVDEMLASLGNDNYLANREAYIQAVTSGLFREEKIGEMGEKAYRDMMEGAKAAELRALREGKG